MLDTGITRGELERLVLLAEECGELLQAIGKVLRHGWNSHAPFGSPAYTPEEISNDDHFAVELSHVQAAINLILVADERSIL